MSILETFYILFESDSSQVKEGAEKAKAPVKGLQEELNSVGNVAKKGGEAFKDFIREAAGAYLALLSFDKVMEGINRAAEFEDKLGKLAKGLDVDVEALSAWGDAVQVNGGSAEGFQETVKSMTAALSDFATKGHSRTAPFFQALGIHMVDAHHRARSFLDILPELADKFSKISKQESLGIGQKMGLDEGTILLLQQGRREVEAMVERQKELGVVTKEQAEIAEKYNDQIDNTKHAFRSLFGEIGMSVLPALTSLLKMFERVAVFARKHTEFITGGLIAIGAAISVYVVPAIASAVVAFAPFLLIGAEIAVLVGLFALLYDDIRNFYEGNDSLLGQMIKKWPIVGEILKFIESVVKNLINDFKNLGMAVVDISKFIATSIVEAFKEVLSVIDKAEKIYGKVKSFASGIGHDVKAMIHTGQQHLSFATTTPLAAQNSNSIMNSNRVNSRSTVVQTGPISISTQASDPDEISKTIGTSLQNQISQALSNFDDGVSA